MNRITYAIKRAALRVLVWSLRLETAWAEFWYRRAKERARRRTRQVLERGMLWQEAVDRLRDLEKNDPSKPAREKIPSRWQGWRGINCRCALVESSPAVGERQAQQDQIQQRQAPAYVSSNPCMLVGCANPYSCSHEPVV